MFVVQFLNLILFVLQVHYKFIPNIWIVFAIILFEGLMGGGAYVNSFYHITKQVNMTSFCDLRNHRQPDRQGFAVLMAMVNVVLKWYTSTTH